MKPRITYVDTDNRYFRKITEPFNSHAPIVENCGIGPVQGIENTLYIYKATKTGKHLPPATMLHYATQANPTVTVIDADGYATDAGMSRKMIKALQDYAAENTLVVLTSLDYQKKNQLEGNGFPVIDKGRPFREIADRIKSMAGDSLDSRL